MESELNSARWAMIFALTFILGLAVLATWQLRVTNYWPLGVDLYSHTVHTRAFWQGTSPYGDQVQRDAEQLVYGRARRAGEPPYPFTYPAYLAILLLPFILIPSSLVGVVWGALMFAILATVVTRWNLAITPRPAVPVRLMLVLGGIAFRPALVSIVNGQYALFVVACVYLARWLCSRRHDIWVGIPLALATVKPSIGLFLPLIILLWAVRWRRWQILKSFIGVTLLLMIATYVRIGWWFADFLYHTTSYAALREGIGLAWSEGQLLTPPGVAWLLLALGVLARGVVELWRTARFPWMALIATMNLNLLLTPHTAEYDLTVLLISLPWLTSEWQQIPAGLPLLIVLLWVPWLSWVAFTLAGFSIDAWWQFLWQWFPSLLLITICLWTMRVWMEPRGRRDAQVIFENDSSD